VKKPPHIIFFTSSIKTTALCAATSAVMQLFRCALFCALRPRGKFPSVNVQLQEQTKQKKDKPMQQFTISEMQEMQKALQEKYKHKWEPICPEIGQNKLLWMIGEIGEVIDIVKKNGGEKACTDAEIRKDLIEEMADVLMYFNDVMLCYGITEEELKKAYTEKFQRNMTRW
jgi:NTP pyrophosphatase (non-canonical NTP hydrolase)